MLDYNEMVASMAISVNAKGHLERAESSEISQLCKLICEASSFSIKLYSQVDSANFSIQMCTV